MCSAARRSPRPTDSTPIGEDGDSEFGDLIEDSEAIQPGEAVSFTLLQDPGPTPAQARQARPAGEDAPLL
jgi:RNA polymerase primary sigma factor